LGRSGENDEVGSCQSKSAPFGNAGFWRRSENGEVYGISHTNSQRNEAYVYLRNPVIDERNYTFNLDNLLGLAGGPYTVKIIYPYRYIHEKNTVQASR